MNRFVAVSLAALVALAACRQEAEKPAEAPAPVAATPKAEAPQLSHREQIEQWQKKRDEGLRKEDSWLTLVGLHWLNEGKNSFGSDGSNTVVLPEGAPAKGGVLARSGEKVSLEPIAEMTIDGKAVAGATPLLNDFEENGPTVVQMGSMRFQVIKRGERIGMRVKDANAPTRVNFKGLEYYPIDEKWRVEAKFEKYDPVKKIPITDVTGKTEDADSPGALVFTLEGKEVRLDPILEQGEDRYFVIFRDATSKDATYQAGRYMYVDPPGTDGKVIVDFNKAYNPPCAFTEFATCPLPPLQNRIPFRIEAGEKRYAGGHH